MSSTTVPYLSLPRLPLTAQLTDENGFPTLELATYWDYFASNIEVSYGNLSTKIIYASSAPTAPNKNDVWIDTSVSPTITRVWDGSAWQQAGTVGASWGTNVSGRPANLAALAGSEGIQNTLVTANADGTLSGAGAGQVTASGLKLDTQAYSADNLVRNCRLLDTVRDVWWPIGNGATLLAGTQIGDPLWYSHNADSSKPTTYFNGGEQIHVTPGETLFISFRARTPYGSTPTQLFEFNWRDALGNVITTGVVSNTLSAANAWNTYTGTIVVPANAAYCTIDQKIQFVGWDTIDITLPRIARSNEYQAGVGANWSTNLTNRPANLSALTGSEAIQNSLVTFASLGGGTVTGSLLSTGTAGVGYAAGAGGSVTQVTSRTTGVTINKICGLINTFSAAPSATYTTFTVTNSTCGLTDIVLVNQQGGLNLYNVIVTAVNNGNFKISYAVLNGGIANESVPIFFTVIKSAIT